MAEAGRLGGLATAESAEFVPIGVVGRAGDGGPALLARVPDAEARMHSGAWPEAEARRPPGPEARVGVIEIDLPDGARVRVDAFVDARALCDIHPSVPSMRAFLPYLDDHWRETVEAPGIASLESISYPRHAPLTARPDWRDESGQAATDLAAVRTQLLDHFGVRLAERAASSAPVITSGSLARPSWLAIARAVAPDSRAGRARPRPLAISGY